MTIAEQELKQDDKSKPKAALLEHPLHALCYARQRIVVQQKGGVLLKGNAVFFRKGYLKLEKVEVEGLHHKVSVPWVLVDHVSIAHIHPEGQAESNGPK